MNNTYNGIMNVYKESGFTSHDVVAKLRGICQMKKIGHTGTLDPEAVGVLPVCLGSGTKLCDMLTDWDKEYIAVLRLGVVTDTQDLSGKILSQCDAMKLKTVTKEDVTEVIMGFIGDYDQVPPMYSALKVDGKKLYELAREGKEVERKPRRVQIKEIEICGMELPMVEMRVVCSKGTYIRTLCHDIGGKLGCGGAMESLTRSRVGIFRLENALTLSELEQLRDEGKISNVIIPPDDVFENDRAVYVNEQGIRMVQNGNRLGMAQLTYEMQTIDFADKEQVRVYGGEGRFYGIYAFYAAERIFKPVKMFLES
ncbi:MAG: tRNA pseudouridine(55) synthase TruB [Lachnospiraceae bacterium]|nr:tRNA pseudouridine(55) synthase TruB [Lachnospiraceae bacterium]